MKITPPDFTFRWPPTVLGGSAGGNGTGGGGTGGGGGAGGSTDSPVVNNILNITINGTTIVEGATLIYNSATNTFIVSDRRWEVLMTDGVTSPPEAVYSEDGTDWLYGLFE